MECRIRQQGLIRQEGRSRLKSLRIEDAENAGEVAEDVADNEDEAEVAEDAAQLMLLVLQILLVLPCWSGGLNRRAGSDRRVGSD